MACVKMCDVCGREFEQRTNAQRHCHECAAKIILVRARLRGRGNRLKGESLFRAIVDEIRSGSVSDACAKRCKFCGSSNDVRSNGFCRTCMSAGLNNVYEITGKSNGWDVRGADAVPVQDGWRGRPVAGGGSLALSKFRGCIALER